MVLGCRVSMAKATLVKPKSRCCKSRTRCKRCPVVCKRLAAEGLAERRSDGRYVLVKVIKKKQYRAARAR